MNAKAGLTTLNVSRRGFVTRLLGSTFIALMATCAQRASTDKSGLARVISLAPAITETLFAIGAGDRVVGVSDYCDYPPDVRSRARAGTALTPNLETIASLRPTLIVAQRVQAVLADELAAIAPVELLSWLTLDEVIASTRSLGRITGCEVAASALADELKARLTRVPPEDSPRVLLAFGSTPGRRGMVSFFRRNSLYGAALAAAGGRNVVDEDIWGVPTMSLEHVIALNPQIVIILIQTDQPDADEDRRYIADWLLLPITASKRGAIRIVRDSAVNTVGPRILRLVDKIAASIQDATKNLQ